MDTSVPIIYAWRAQPQRLSAVGRLWAAAVSAGCLAVLTLAAFLKPDPSGFGSHRQLGLAVCSFEQRTNVPCPTCGMTTSFAHFVRGQFLASLYVQPMGTVLAAAAAMTFWGALYIAVTGRPAHRLLRFLPARYYLIPLFTLAILAWIWKIVIHVRGLDGWT